MAKRITNTSKFVRAVLAQEIENPMNQPYTVGKAADLVAYLRTVASEMLEDDWVSRYDINVPDGWRTPQGKFGDRDAAGNLTQEHKTAVKYGRKFIHRDLDREDCPFKRVINPDASTGDDDVIIMKAASES